jgi:hypothetical protein
MMPFVKPVSIAPDGQDAPVQAPAAAAAAVSV